LESCPPHHHRRLYFWAIPANSWKVALLTITGGELRLPSLGYYLQALIDNGTIGGPIIL